MTRRMNDGYICTVVEYNGANDISVRYEDGKVVKNKSFQNFMRG